MAARLDYPRGVAVAPDDSVNVVDTYVNGVIRRVSLLFPTADLDDIALPSEDGSLIYHFDRTGRHLATLDALTQAVLLTYRYDVEGRLYEVEDVDENVTTIEWNPDGTPAAVEAPFGQRTTFTTDANGYVNGISSPEGDVSAVYTADGLMESWTDARGITTTFQYDTAGRLEVHDNPGPGLRTFTRTELDSTPVRLTGTEVTVTTALGRTTTYRTERMTDTRVIRQTTGPDGLTTELVIYHPGYRELTTPDGTVVVQAFGPDPRFGMLVPVTELYEVHTPDGIISTVTASRTTDPPICSVSRRPGHSHRHGDRGRSHHDERLRHGHAHRDHDEPWRSPGGSDARRHRPAHQRPDSRPRTGGRDLRHPRPPRDHDHGHGRHSSATVLGYDPVTGYMDSVTDPHRRGLVLPSRRRWSRRDADAT